MDISNASLREARTCNQSRLRTAARPRTRRRVERMHRSLDAGQGPSLHENASRMFTGRRNL